MMEYPLSEYQNTLKDEKTSKGSQWHYCQGQPTNNHQQFSIFYTIADKFNRKKFPKLEQADAEVSS